MGRWNDMPRNPIARGAVMAGLAVGAFLVVAIASSAVPTLLALIGWGLARSGLMDIISWLVVVVMMAGSFFLSAHAAYEWRRDGRRRWLAVGGYLALGGFFAASFGPTMFSAIRHLP